MATKKSGSKKSGDKKSGDKKSGSKKSPPKKRLSKAEQIAQMPIEDIISSASGGNRTVLEKYASTLKGGYTRRINQFSKAGVFSYAQEAYEKNGPAPDRKTPFKKMSYNQLVHEIARYQSFFNSQTSTISGINEINREQDARLFGVDENGNPLDTLTNEERTLMWSLYMEYRNQYKGKFGSNQQQRMLATMVKQGVENLDVPTILRRARDRLYYRSRRENEQEQRSTIHEVVYRKQRNANK